MDVVVVTVVGSDVQTFGHIGVGLFQLTVVDGVGIVGTGGYVGHFVAGVVQTVFGQFDVTCFNAVLGQCDIVADFHTVVVNGGIAGFDAVYHQVFVQLDGHFIALGFSRDVVVAGNGHGRTEFFDIGAAAVAVEGQAFGVNGGFGIHTFLDVVFGAISQVDAVVGHVVRICSGGGNGHFVGTCARSRAFGVDGVNVLAVGSGRFNHVFDVGTGCNLGTRCGALLFQLAVVDGVGVIGTGGYVGDLVAGGIDAGLGHTRTACDGEAV